ncbi:hypothetical protein PTKIN_Ptkin15bG0131700 [Pterospermum kingtungense]
MAKYWSVVLVLALVAVHASARNVPSDAGLNDQKNFLTYGGVGGYSGVGPDGMPIGGIGSVGGVTGLDGTGGLGGLSGIGFGSGAGGVGGGAGTGGGSGTGGVIHFP